MANIDSRQFSNFLSLFTEFYMCFLANETRRNIWTASCSACVMTPRSLDSPYGRVWTPAALTSGTPTVTLHFHTSGSWWGSFLAVSLRYMSMYFFQHFVSYFNNFWFIYIYEYKKWLKVQQLNKEPLWFIQWISESLDWFKPEKQYRNTVVMLLFSVAKAILC